MILEGDRETCSMSWADVRCAVQLVDTFTLATDAHAASSHIVESTFALEADGARGIVLSSFTTLHQWLTKAQAPPNHNIVCGTGVRTEFEC